MIKGFGSIIFYQKKSELLAKFYNGHVLLVV